VNFKENDIINIIIAGTAGQGVITLKRLIEFAAQKAGIKGCFGTEHHGLAQREGAIVSHTRYQKKLNKNEATDLLNFFIENSDHIEIRKNSLLAFELLDLKNEEAFHILQNCLLSDENPTIRNTAAKVLTLNFPEKSKNLLKWAREHDKDLKF